MCIIKHENQIQEFHANFIYRTYTPWPHHESCSNFKTSFSKNRKLPIVGLFSYPNSGNTWMRYLIEGVTGIFSGSFYIAGCISIEGNIIFFKDSPHLIISLSNTYSIYR